MFTFCWYVIVPSVIAVSIRIYFTCRPTHYNFKIWIHRIVLNVQDLERATALVPTAGETTSVSPYVQLLTMCWSLSRCMTLDAQSAIGTRSGDRLTSLSRHSAALCFTESIVSLATDATTQTHGDNFITSYG